MIILYHDGKRPVKVLNETKKLERSFFGEVSINKLLFSLAKEYSNELILWCHIDLKDNLNIKSVNQIFHHNKIMCSYSTSGDNVISKSIGYVDQSPFIRVKKNVSYPTWLMSSDVGGCHASVLEKFVSLQRYENNFSVLLSTIGKIGQSKGLLCYSEPLLLTANHIKIHVKKVNIFNFVNKHYKKSWLYLLMLNLLIYEKRIPIIQFLRAFLSKERLNLKLDLDDIQVASSNINEEFTVDVIIPTLGRKNFLLDVLIDLSHQTLLPKNVIIIEQTKNGKTELDYLSNRKWPFKIIHQCIKQFGACNSRNIALEQVTSNWVFFADDDIRMSKEDLTNVKNFINQYGCKSVTIGTFQKEEKLKNLIVSQSSNFGTGSSFVQAKAVQKIRFKMEHEFGYGEDVDFGMQLRNTGIDILYNPKIQMLHLKAPVGGFRYKFKPLWLNEATQPKPSPTVMAYQLKHATAEQLCGYKTILFLKFYKNQNIKNPVKYFRLMNLKWKASLYWAKKMINNEF